MIVIMERGVREGLVARVVERLAVGGARVQRLNGERVTLAASGGTGPWDDLAGMAGVASVLEDQGATPLVAGTTARPTPAAPPPGAEEEKGFQVGERWVGRGDLFVVAGPCSVEDPETMQRIASAVASAGAAGLRAGAFKPRSSPYAFQGMGEEGLAVAHRAARDHGLLLVSEVLDGTQIPVAVRYVDILQVGSRNMYNTPLLRELGRARKPVLLKRGFSATIDEWLSAAEYIVSAGNPRVILCERGIRTFETATRNTLDLNAIPVLRERTRLPVLVDPSHGTGRRGYVRAMARAAVAAGADGLLIEVHTEPDRAVSDAAQTVDRFTFEAIIREARALREVLGAAVD